jgi:hypothetical protein
LNLIGVWIAEWRRNHSQEFRTEERYLTLQPDDICLILFIYLFLILGLLSSFSFY